MYEVLIVDDEPISRQSLKYLIDWEASGFMVSGEAEDGVEALKMLKLHRYSLVLTDIRMPLMNGLDFIERLREFSDVPVVILSGYEDFDYARQGMKLGVQEYLLKPVEEEELIGVLLKVATSIRENGLYQRQHDLAMSALYDQFLRKLVHGQMSLKEYKEQALVLKLPTPIEGGCCLLVEMDFVYDVALSESNIDVELKRFAVRNVLEELIAGSGYVFEESDERYGVVLTDVRRANVLTSDELHDFSQRISESVSTYVKATVSIGIGIFVLDAISLAISFDAAEVALDGKFLKGNNSILQGLPENGEQLRSAVFQSCQADILEGLRSYDEERIVLSLGALWEEFNAVGAPSGVVRVEVLHILVQLYQLVKQIGADTGSLFDVELGDYERVMRAKTIDELLRFTEEKCLAVLRVINRTRNLQPNKVTGTVMQIVQEQYPNTIKLRNIAEQVYLNPNYLSKLFKTVTGQSFNDYLLQVRMDKAKELLRDTDKKVYEVASEVGYSELDWFYKRFKMYTGLSTGEYRAQFKR